MTLSAKEYRKMRGIDPALMEEARDATQKKISAYELRELARSHHRERVVSQERGMPQ